MTIVMVCIGATSAQNLNNPIKDGCYIVKWDCEQGTFAESNDFEVDETFTFAIDITGTSWVNWLNQKGTKGTRMIATNFSFAGNGEQDVNRNGDRLFHIKDNIYGKTINLKQLATVALNLRNGSEFEIHSNLFGFEYNEENAGASWYMNPGEEISANGNYFFKTAPYTGTRTCPDFMTSDYNGCSYKDIDCIGYAAPCVVSNPCYNGESKQDIQFEEETINPTPQHMDGSDVYTFPTDAQQRGYYNRPYERYEAEESWCNTDGTFLQPSDDQRTLQSEASHQQAVQLINQNSYISWTVNKAGDGLTIRFSLPDNAEGTGTKGNIDIYANNDKVGSLELDSYWAWQYCSRTYPTNNPNNGPVVRMKYDEMHLRLSRMVKQGETLKIVKTDNNNTPYTIDFVELEPVPAKVTFESLSGDKVQFTGGDVADFIASNQGKIIYFSEGKWETNKRIYLTGDNTQLIGAGMWYTTIYFTASSYDSGTYDKRGIEGHANNCHVEGLYMNTVNNQRYMNENDSKQVGKGFMGWWGNNSVIRNCWVEHFECGAWIDNRGSYGSNNLLIEHCRFRNNYADGVNCSHNTHNHTIQYCSFRNNGDDDMASWSTSVRATNITFAYNTAENNWRASSLGFFGGEQHHAHHIYIADALESGARVNSDFSGQGFSQNGRISIHDITIQHCAGKAGSKGTSGDFWGSKQGALNIGSTSAYPIYNVDFSNIDIWESRDIALFIRAQSGKALTDLTLQNICVNGATYGMFFSGARGTMQYCNLIFHNCTTSDMNTIPANLSWTEMPGCGTDLEEVNNASGTMSNNRFFINGKLFIRVHDGLYDAMGHRF